MSRKRTVHWIGGVKHARGEMLGGWVCCCSGERCKRISNNMDICTRSPNEVTCAACLRWMRKDIQFERWGIK